MQQKHQKEGMQDMDKDIQDGQEVHEEDKYNNENLELNLSLTRSNIMYQYLSEDTLVPSY